MESTPKYQYFNGIRFTRDNKTGYYLSSRKVKDGKRQRMHVYVWECYHGDVPPQYHVHHRNHNKADNRIENLTILPESEHHSTHAILHAREYPERIGPSLESARKAAALWHKSEAGRDWHKKQYEQTKHVLRVPKEFMCQWCGKQFMSPKSGSKFCSNNCRAAARRASHVDDVERRCETCGELFYVNKYDKQNKCPACRRGKNRVQTE